jgi:hypothetical protein
MKHFNHHKLKIDPFKITEEQFIQFYGRIIFSQYVKFIDKMSAYNWDRFSMPYIKVRFYAKNKKNNNPKLKFTCDQPDSINVTVDTELSLLKGAVDVRIPDIHSNDPKRPPPPRIPPRPQNQDNAITRVIDQSIMGEYKYLKSKIIIDKIQIKHIPITTRSVTMSCLLDITSDNDIASEPVIRFRDVEVCKRCESMKTIQLVKLDIHVTPIEQKAISKVQNKIKIIPRISSHPQEHIKGIHNIENRVEDPVILTPLILEILAEHKNAPASIMSKSSKNEQNKNENTGPISSFKTNIKKSPIPYDDDESFEKYVDDPGIISDDNDDVSDDYESDSEVYDVD